MNLAPAVPGAPVLSEPLPAASHRRRQLRCGATIRAGFYFPLHPAVPRPALAVRITSRRYFAAQTFRFHLLAPSSGAVPCRLTIASSAARDSARSPASSKASPTPSPDSAAAWVRHFGCSLCHQKTSVQRGRRLPNRTPRQLRELRVSASTTPRATTFAAVTRTHFFLWLHGQRVRAPGATWTPRPAAEGAAALERRPRQVPIPGRSTKEVALLLGMVAGRVREGGTPHRQATRATRGRAPGKRRPDRNHRTINHFYARAARDLAESPCFPYQPAADLLIGTTGRITNERRSPSSKRRASGASTVWRPTCVYRNWVRPLLRAQRRCRRGP
jgi:hypothetical protein